MRIQAVTCTLHRPMLACNEHDSVLHSGIPESSTESISNLTCGVQMYEVRKSHLTAIQYHTWAGRVSGSNSLYVVVHLSTYGVEGSGRVQYSWSVTGGTVLGQGPEADWSLTGVKPGTLYTAKLTISDASE